LRSFGARGKRNQSERQKKRVAKKRAPAREMGETCSKVYVEGPSPQWAQTDCHAREMEGEKPEKEIAAKPGGRYAAKPFSPSPHVTINACQQGEKEPQPV